MRPPDNCISGRRLVTWKADALALDGSGELGLPREEQVEAAHSFSAIRDGDIREDRQSLRSQQFLGDASTDRRTLRAQYIITSEGISRPKSPTYGVHRFYKLP